MGGQSKITFLVDNNAQADLKEEHGLAILIEHQGLRILFDNGSGEALFYNAQRLNQALDNVDVLILSHGHYDHTENTEWLLQHNPNAKIYLHPSALQTRYSKHANKPLKLVAMTKANQQAILQFPKEQVCYHTGVMKISEQLILSGQIPRRSEEDAGGPFYLDSRCKASDHLLDDQCLWLVRGDEIHIITGCCHAGLINTLQWTREQNPDQKITSLTGGLHLTNASPPRIQASIEVLKQTELKSLYPGHCTGESVSNELKQLLEPVTHVNVAQAGLSYYL